MQGIAKGTHARALAHTCAHVHTHARAHTQTSTQARIYTAKVKDIALLLGDQTRLVTFWLVFVSLPLRSTYSAAYLT